MTDTRDLVPHLRRLLAESPTRVADVSGWVALASEVQRCFADQGLTPAVPHFVWHYLSDGDIRAKDPTYRERQNEMLAALIAQIEGQDPLRR